MSLYLISGDSSGILKSLGGMSIKQAGYKEDWVRDMVAKDIGKFFPGLITIATEFSYWQDSTRRLDILAMDAERRLHVIEFKRDDDAGHAELQALRYAAMLSVCTFEDVIAAGYKYRQKLDSSLSLTAWHEELSKFLKEESLDDLDFGRIPRIILVSSKFNKEITTTVLWLNESFGSLSEDVDGMDISCHEVTVYDLGDQRTLHFDQVIPIPEAQEYQVRARAKGVEEAKKQAKVKRTRTISLLLKEGILKPGVRIRLNESKVKALGDLQDSEKISVYTDDGCFLWEFDEVKYKSLNALMLKLFQNHGVSMKSLQAPFYWGIEGNVESLAEKADNIFDNMAS